MAKLRALVRLAGLGLFLGAAVIGCSGHCTYDPSDSACSMKCVSKPSKCRCDPKCPCWSKHGPSHADQ
jgi:hypothetical protein